jgi:hypothetical protein
VAAAAPSRAARAEDRSGWALRTLAPGVGAGRPQLPTRSAERWIGAFCVRASVSWRAGRPEAAEERFLRSLNYHFIAGARSRADTPASVWAATPARPSDGVRQTIERSLVDHLAQDPDPVEWSFFVRALLCQGKVAEAAQRAAPVSRDDSPGARAHPPGCVHARRPRWVVTVVRRTRAPRPSQRACPTGPRNAGLGRRPVRHAGRVRAGRARPGGARGIACAGPCAAARHKRRLPPAAPVRPGRTCSHLSPSPTLPAPSGRHGANWDPVGRR